MIWTTTTPTEPGWYWTRRDGSQPRIVEVRQVGTSELWVEADRSSTNIRAYTGFEWNGPLQPPGVVLKPARWRSSEEIWREKASDKLADEMMLEYPSEID